MKTNLFLKVTLLNFRTLIISCCLFFTLSLFICEPVYSRGGGGGGGCFSEGTLILTPKGNKRIEQLDSGDRIINYNFSTQEQDEGTIGKIEIIKSPDFYLINHQTKVTGSHPFYLHTSKGNRLTQVQNLHQGDRLIDQNNALIAIDSIEHVFKPISVYNLTDIEPNHNFYADGFLVHNKGSGGGGGGYGRGGSSH